MNVAGYCWIVVSKRYGYLPWQGGFHLDNRNKVSKICHNYVNVLVRGATSHKIGLARSDLPDAAHRGD